MSNSNVGVVPVVIPVKAFSTALIKQGVSAIGSTIQAGLLRAEWFKALKKHGVKLTNIKEFRKEFDRTAVGYLETKFEGLGAWMIGAKDSKGTIQAPFVNTKGAKYTKREIETLIRTLRIFWENEFIRTLTGESRTKMTRVERTVFEQDVRAFYPRLVAYQRLENPLQYQLDHLRLIQGVIEHAIAFDPKAKVEFNQLEAKASKLIK